MAQVQPNQKFGREFPQLSPNQQSLLLAALTSRENNKSKSYPPLGAESNGAAAFQNGFADASVASLGVNPSILNSTTFGDKMFPNVDPTFDDVPNGLDFGDPFGDLPGVDGEEHHEKRKSPEEEDEDEDEEDSPNKRQEGEDKTAKKPGRKPLTTEPTTKRKAQNRAAQRAFRERKEKHLKDLEQKVVDLEKASESANHENGLLRAQVERLHTELRDYRKRLSTAGSAVSRSPGSMNGQATFQDRGANISDFQFDFPKFGNLSNGPLLNNASFTDSPIQSTTSPDTFSRNSFDASGLNSTRSLSHSSAMQSPENIFAGRMNSVSPRSAAEDLGGLFSPSLLNSVSNSDYGFMSSEAPPIVPASIFNTQSNVLRQQSLSQSASNTASPSASSQSQNGPTSSAGTSPEPMLNSPATKLNTVPDTLNSSPAKTTAKTPGADFSSFDWLASQNGGQFDPVLFGDYRESQDAIIGGGEFSGGFFEDSFADLGSEFFNTATDSTIPAPPPAQESLLDQIEREKSGTAKDEELVVPGDDEASFMTCHKIWNKLQDCPKFQSGDFDIDSLCTELQAKAKCSETGVVVPKADVEKALWKLVGHDQQAMMAQQAQEQNQSTSYFQGMAG